MKHPIKHGIYLNESLPLILSVFSLCSSKAGNLFFLEINIKGIEITISAIDFCKVKIMVPKLCENGKL